MRQVSYVFLFVFEQNFQSSSTRNDSLWSNESVSLLIRFAMRVRFRLASSVCLHEENAWFSLQEIGNFDIKERLFSCFDFTHFSGLKRSGDTRKGQMGTRMRKSNSPLLITFFVLVLSCFSFLFLSVGD